MIFEKTSLGDYDTSAFFNVDWDEMACSCIQHHKTEQIDLYPDGFPDTFVLDNTTIYQKFFSKEEADYEALGKLTGVEVVSLSIIKQKPGHMIPMHRDMFYKIGLAQPDRTDPKVRANIFLGDWKPGQYLEFNEEPCTHWKKNDGFIFDQDVIHLSVNAGGYDKYTLQISGFYNA